MYAFNLLHTKELLFQCRDLYIEKEALDFYMKEVGIDLYSRTY